MTTPEAPDPLEALCELYVDLGYLEHAGVDDAGRVVYRGTDLAWNAPPGAMERAAEVEIAKRSEHRGTR